MHWCYECTVVMSVEYWLIDWLIVCVLHRPETFGRKHSPVAHRRQCCLSVQSTDTQWPGRVTGSEASGSGWVGSRVKWFRPDSISGPDLSPNATLYRQPTGCAQKYPEVHVQALLSDTIMWAKSPSYWSDSVRLLFAKILPLKLRHSDVIFVWSWQSL